jgi:Ca-activated chloride channel homolog
MLRNSTLSIALAGLIALLACAFTGANCSIGGKITEITNNEEVPFATVSLFKNDTVLVSRISTDLNGEYCFTGLQPGTYKIAVAAVGCDPMEKKNIVYNGTSATTVNLKVNGGRELKELEISNVTVSENLSKSTSQGISKQRKITGYNAPCAAYDLSGNSRFSSTMEMNTEEYSKIDDNEFKEVSKNALSTFSIDVDRASYSNVRRFINQGSLPPADAVRVEEMINYFSYNYPQPSGNDPFSINTEYTDCPWNSKHKLIHIGLQGKEVKMENAPANNLVFLVDVSGSMGEPNKLPLLVSGLSLLVDQMRAQDKVAVVVYAGAAGVVVPSTSGLEKDKIIDALERLQSGGSTAGGEGIVLAYKVAKENFLKEGNNRVILATDGDFNVGVSSDGELVRLIEKEREQGIFLTVLGFGMGNYKDSKMEQLADKGNGNYSYIDNILEAKKTLVKEMGGTLLTIAKDVKIQIEFNPAFVKSYRLVGYENRLLANEDFNDDKKDAGELGSGHTVTAMYEIIPAGSSEPTASIDPLKYQQVAPTAAATGDEVMTIKFRYKEPNENTSKLITKVLNNKSVRFESSSENCRFACAVAEFGMVLRDSKFKGEGNYQDVIAKAKSAKGKDDEGYRAEFIRLVEMATLLKK